MLLDHSVMQMNGSPPVPFSPAWSDGPGVGPGQDIPVESLSITRGVVASRDVNRQVTVTGNLEKVAALTLEILDQAGASTVLPGIPFRLSGDPAHEVTFDSRHQRTPWSFLFKVNSESGQIVLSFTLNYSGLSVDDALNGVMFYQALAGGGEFKISGRHPITGGAILLARGKIPRGSYEAADPRFIELLQDLAFIQSKTETSFKVPERNIRYQDASTVAATAKILKTGHAMYQAEPWVSVSKVEQAESALESFTTKETIPMALHFDDQVVMIFGTPVQLGPVTLFCNRSYIAEQDLEALRKDLKVAVPGSYVSIKFTPFEGCPIEGRYINWLPKDEADAVRQLPMYAATERVAGDLTFPQIDVSAAIALLNSWYEDDADEQKRTWEDLRSGLDEDRLSDRKLFQ